MLKRKVEEKADTGEIKSILSEGLNIDGNITAEGKIRIDGTVNGNVKGNFVILGQSSKITGNVEAEKLVAMGEIKGNVKSETAEIKSSAKISGDILVKELSVEPGASVEGKVQTGEFLIKREGISSVEITE